MNASHYGIAVFWSDEDGCWIATIPDLRYCSAHGDTREEALREVLIAERVTLQSLGDRNDPVPEVEWLPEEARELWAQDTGNASSLVHVTSVEPLEGFVLRLSFSDGLQKDEDVEWLLRGPVFEPIRNDPAIFRQVKVDEQCGTIVWPGEVDIDPVVLHGSAQPAWKEDEAASKMA